MNCQVIMNDDPSTAAAVAVTTLASDFDVGTFRVVSK